MNLLSKSERPDGYRDAYIMSFKSTEAGSFLRGMALEATTRIELVIAVLQTAALTTWLRRPESGAGDGIRTRDIQLGKLTLYH
jgi:hypothetical protein